MLLGLSGLTREERGMIQASGGNERDFDRVAEALILQHPRIYFHENRRHMARDTRQAKSKNKDSCAVAVSRPVGLGAKAMAKQLLIMRTTRRMTTTTTTTQESRGKCDFGNTWECLLWWREERGTPAVDVREIRGLTSFLLKPTEYFIAER